MVTAEQLAEARRDLGRRLASLREAAGLTQAQVAKLTGYTRSALANVETGRSGQPRTCWVRYDQLLGAGGALLASYDHYASLTTRRRQQAAQERERQRTAKIEQWLRAHTSTGTDGGSSGQPITDRTAVAGILSHDSLLANADASDEVNRRDLLAAGGIAVAGVALSNPARAAQAFGIAIMDDVDRVAAAVDQLYGLIDHYSEAICRTPSVAVYGDLFGVREFAGRLITDACPPARRQDLVVATGWLSNLLAVAASYLGDHASALVWCTDAERRGQDTGNPELAGWASLTRSMIAYYQGHGHRSVILAGRGQRVAPIGTAVHARLAAQEMRARAMLGDVDGMAQARHRAASTLAKLSSNVPRTGTFSVALGYDPPYTATSLLLVGQFEEAASATRRVLDTVYSGSTSGQEKQTSNYARTLLILALAEAGRGNPAEAAEAGRRALSSAAPVWPTMVLADELDRTLVSGFPGVAAAADYHACYLEAAGRRPHLTASQMEDCE